MGTATETVNPNAMTKAQFIGHVKALYRAANMADSDNPLRSHWMHTNMVTTVCSRLDRMLSDMETDGVLTDDERQAIYDTL